jgi:Fe-S-cluster containining protein
MSTELPVFYNCMKCPAYCCSYARIEITDEDLARLAGHHGISVRAAKKRFTATYVEDGESEMVLRHQKDEIYGSVCRFLDTETRACTVHPARPEICRDHPGKPTCAYYAFLMSERDYQEDPDQIVRAYNAPGDWVPLD